MVTVAIYNSYSNITGLTAAREKELRQLLSYVVGGKNAYFSRYGAKRRSLLSKKGEFPTGLIHRVKTYLHESLVKFNVINARIIPTHTQHAAPAANIKPYLSQLTARSQAIKHGRGIISMPTGSGKSLVIKLIIFELKLKTLIVVPSLEIKNQLSKDFEGVNWVTIENIDSSRLNTSTDYDVLIIDEGHHVAAKTYRSLNKTAWNNIYYRFFLTATPFRNDSEEQLLFESIAGKVIYKLSYIDAISQGYIVPVAAYYIECPKQKTDAYTYPEVYKELVVNNEARNTIISNLLNQLLMIEKSTLCLVREVAHGKVLSEMTGIPFVSGEDEASRDYIRQFNSGGIMSLIATEGVCGEGIDTKPCEFVVIAGLGKAKSAFMQKIGRCLRKYPDKEYGKVIIFKDKSNKYLLRHFKEQCKILKEEYAITCEKLNI